MSDQKTTEEGTPGCAASRAESANSTAELGGTVLGVTKPHWSGQILGTRFECFESTTGLDGLAKIKGSRLDLLAVVSKRDGAFRNFIARAKTEFTTVCIWEVWNNELPAVLKRYGFQEVAQIDEDTFENLTCWRWDALPPNVEHQGLPKAVAWNEVLGAERPGKA